MKLQDITKNLSNMSEDELREHVKFIRNTKYNVRPAKAKHIADVVKKESRHRTTKVDKLVNKMSDTEKQQLLLLLESEDEEA